MTFCIAEAGVNHNGQLENAIKLIDLAAKSGADAVKLQHFEASTILDKNTFDSLPTKAHQAKWKKSVYQTYEDACTPIEWSEEIFKACKKARRKN